MGRIKKRHLPHAGLAAALALALALSGVLAGRAVWDEAAAVHANPAEIEPSTLVVGTHLIHLSALTDSIYAVAERSAEESGQAGLYYRSELAGGAWFEITAATTLADITTAGTPVPDSVIAALFLTHHTKSDGVTYDLRTGLPVDIRDIYDPYDLESMEELFPLKTQYDLLRETQSKSKAGEAKIERAEKFFATKVSNDEADRINSELDALKVYYGLLSAGGGTAAECRAVQEVMDAVDAQRRAAVFTIVEEALSAYLDELSTVSDEKGGDMPDTNLQSAVSDSLNNVRASRIAWEGRMLSPGTTVTTSVRYTYARSLVDHAYGATQGKADAEARAEEAAAARAEAELRAEAAAAAKASAERQLQLLEKLGAAEEVRALTEAEAERRGEEEAAALAEAEAAARAEAESLSYDPCDTDVRNLLTLNNVVDSVYTDRAAELAMLEGVLIPQAEGVYTGGLGAGQSADYNTALAQGAADVLLRSIARDNTSLLNAYRNELEFFLTAITERQSADGAMAYLDNRLTMAQDWYALPPSDAFAEGAGATVDAHIAFLTRLRREAELAAGGNALDALTAEKADLQREMMACLDGNDLSGAKALEDRIAGLDGQIQALSEAGLAELSGLTDQLGQLQTELDAARAAGDEALAGKLEGEAGTLRGRIAALNGSMAGGTLGARVAQLKSDALAAVADGDGQAALSGAEALAGLLGQDHRVVIPALKDLHAAMARAREIDGSRAFDEGLAAVEDAILNNADAYAAALRTEHTADDLSRIAADFFASAAGTDALLQANAGTGAPGGAGTAFGGTGETGALPGSGSGASVGDYVGPAASGGGDGAGGAVRPSGGRVGTGELTLALSGNPAVNLIALEMYCAETGSAEAAALLQSLALQELGLGNPLVFQRVDDAGREYLPLTALGGYTGMRYVWNRGLSAGTLACGAVYYGFTAYSDQVKRSRDAADADAMVLPARLQNNVLHVCEDYTARAFGAEAVYLSGTHYGVLCDAALMEEALALFAAFLE